MEINKHFLSRLHTEHKSPTYYHADTMFRIWRCSEVHHAIGWFWFDSLVESYNTL